MSFTLKRLAYRLRPGWIPNDWEAHVPGLAYYLRIPPEWYVSHISNFSFMAHDSDTMLRLEVTSLAVGERHESAADYLRCIIEEQQERGDAVVETNRQIRLPGVSDANWFGFHQERPLFDFEPCGRALWLRLRYEDDAHDTWTKESYVFQRDKHILEARYTYPRASQNAVRPLVRRSARTIRISTRA